MRILVGWDDSSEADLLKTFLRVDNHEVEVSTDPDTILMVAQDGSEWDAVLLSTDLPDAETGFQVFQKLREALPETPFVAAVRSSDVYRIARFLTNGLRGYLIRDAAGDFMFLARAVLSGAVRSLEAERERLISRRLRDEIESVRKLQSTIIPTVIDCPNGYEIAARYESSQIRVIGGKPVTMAGGDYYDVFPLPNGSLALLVGDASGHGMKACLSIMTMHTLIRLLRENRFVDTAQFVAQVNRQLCQQTIINDDGGFITLIYGVLDPRTHRLTWTSAGHPVPLLHRLEQNDVVPIAGQEAPGLPLGIVEDAEYREQSSEIPSGSRLLLYTDGLVEAFPVSGHHHHEFGEEGLRGVLRATRDRELKQALQQLFDASLEFTGGEGRHDDTSVVLLQRSHEPRMS